jgi:hypothetical protein
MSRKLTPSSSLENLKKEAKRWLHALRSDVALARERLERAFPNAPTLPTLRDVQHALALEHGLPGWIALRDALAGRAPADTTRLAPFEQLAKDLVAAHGRGDTEALRRLSDHFAHNVTRDEVRKQVEQRIGTVAFGLAEAQRLVAGLYGFGNWVELAGSLTRPPSDPRSASAGMSSTPPFYRIHRNDNTLEPRPPLSDADWDTILGVMKEMGVTGLNGGGHLTDAAMAKVAQCDFITKLDLGGSNRLSDGGLRHLQQMPQLRELHLGGWDSTITDRGLEVIRHLTELRRFHMVWTRTVSDAGAAWLSWCDHLEDVNLMGSTTGDGAINALTGKHHLSRFSTGRLVTDAGLPLLHRFPAFKAWQGGTPEYDLMSFQAKPNSLLLDGSFSDAGFARMAGLDGLFGLNLFWHVSAMSPEGLAPLKDLANLGFLGCHGRLATDDAMPHIAAIPRLRMLMAQGTVASDDGFTALSRSPTVEYIWGRECPNLQGRGFRALADMPVLKGIAVSCKFVDDASLAALPRFPALTWLLPMDVPDEGFRHVGRCAQIERLTCMYCRDTGDVATEHLAGLSRLKHYYAGQTRITDRSLEVLSGMTSLEEVELSACAGISDAGLVHIARLPRLRKVSVDATARVTREGIAVFPAHVRVDFW